VRQRRTKRSPVRHRLRQSGGESYTPAYPCPIGAYQAISRWFTSAHEHCLPLGSRPRVLNDVSEPLDWTHLS